VFCFKYDIKHDGVSWGFCSVKPLGNVKNAD